MHKRVEVPFWALAFSHNKYGVEIVRLQSWEPDPAGRGDYSTRVEIGFESLRELVRRYERLLPYTPDLQILLVEDGG